MKKNKKGAGRPAKIKKPIEKTKPQAPDQVKPDPASGQAPDQVQPDPASGPAPDQVQPDPASGPAPAQSSVILESEISKIIPAPGPDAALIPAAPAAGIGEPGQAPVCSQEDIDNFAGAVLGLFDVIAIRAGDHWKLEPIEAKSIGKPLAKVFFKYLPNFKHSDEMFLALAVGGIVLPRIKQTIELNNIDPGAADQKKADQLAADRQAAEKRAADQLAAIAARKAADQLAADNMEYKRQIKLLGDQLADQKIAAGDLARKLQLADQLAAEKKAADQLADQGAADQISEPGTDQGAADQRQKVIDQLAANQNNQAA